MQILAEQKINKGYTMFDKNQTKPHLSAGQKATGG